MRLIKWGFGPISNMQIYLEHPVHGRKIASAEAEAEFDEKHGWVRYDPMNTIIAPVMKQKLARKIELEGS